MILARRTLLLLAIVLALPSLAHAQTSSPPPATGSSSPASATAGILPSSEAERLLPSSILFKGQLAPVQARNSGVLRLPDGSLIVAALVDSSGYSSGVRERFQFLLYTEVPLTLGGRTLPAGFYGGGFLANNTMAVLDVSGKDVLTAPTFADPSLKRPRPLQMLAGPAGGAIRLYLGRAYLDLVPAR